MKNKTIQKNKVSKNRMPKHATRYIAARALQDVFDKQLPLDQALSTQALFPGLAPRDRAFARLISATVLRRMGQIDIVLAAFIKKPPTGFALFVLRCGVAQLLFIGTPAHAAVDGAVSLLKRSKKTQRMAGMANAVLRRVSQKGGEILEKTQPLDNIPNWLQTSWRTAYGEQACILIAEMAIKEPPLDITLKSENPDWPEKLTATSLPSGTLRREKAGQITELPGFKDGDWWVQDISASLPVKLLGDIKGKTVLDMCAAPGGKTLQLAAAGAHVTALDKSEDRLLRVKENLSRTHLKARTICADAAKWQGDRADNELQTQDGFDIVLLDAPCSASGIFRRRPDVLHTKTPQNVRSLVRVQEKLLDNAAHLVKKGGVLMYCTCSLQKEEAEERCTEFLKNRSDFRLNSILSKEIYGLDELIVQDGYLRILPHFLAQKGGMDGFFIARFTRC